MGFFLKISRFQAKLKESKEDVIENIQLEQKCYQPRSRKLKGVHKIVFLGPFYTDNL